MSSSFAVGIPRAFSCDVTDRGAGASKGRGPRCAGWMKDYINEVDGDLEVVVMNGGAKGWAQTYGGHMMDHYVEDHWHSEDTDR